MAHLTLSPHPLYYVHTTPPSTGQLLAGQLVCTRPRHESPPTTHQPHILLSPPPPPFRKPLRVHPIEVCRGCHSVVARVRGGVIRGGTNLSAAAFTCLESELAFELSRGLSHGKSLSGCCTLGFGKCEGLTGVCTNRG